jgi:hypothetical protein
MANFFQTILFGSHDYSVQRKFALVIKKWKASLGTENQLREPTAGDVLSYQEMSRISTFELDNFKRHRDQVWRSLYKRDTAAYKHAGDLADLLDTNARWDSAERRAQTELEVLRSRVAEFESASVYPD